MIVLIGAIVAAVIAVVALVRSQAQSLEAWAVLVLAAALVIANFA